MTKTVRAHTNIALIKYWGKANDELKIPWNSSISLTLDQFYTDTSVTYDPLLEADVFFLDGELVSDKVAKRVYEFMAVVRKMYHLPYFARIASHNHVPKEAGLASSASAFAALAKAATLDLGLSDGDVSRLARLGSGSASRSIYPGFARWERGDDHQSSVASPITMAPWDDFRMIVCMINDKIKPYPSGAAMEETVAHSPYYKAWVAAATEDGVALQDALVNHDIWRLGLIAQTNALRMHASLLAINKWYFEPQTIEVMNCVREMQKTIPVFFTMDAGPNVKLITTAEHVDTICASLPQTIKTIVCKSGPGIHVL